jgi:hypothetical protein
MEMTPELAVHHIVKNTIYKTLPTNVRDYTHTFRRLHNNIMSEFKSFIEAQSDEDCFDFDDRCEIEIFTRKAVVKEVDKYKRNMF